MFDIQFAISIIICAIGIAVFLATTFLLIWNLVDGYDFMSIRGKGYIIASMIGLVIFFISLFFVVKYYKLSNSPNVVHERLLNNLDKAEKELQKFYIDHSEFKEIKEK